jgi:triacylglycerol lipase
LRDLAYGADPRQRLDVFAPAAATGSLPVVLFVHGGGFVGGDKGNDGDPFYNNIGAWAVQSGFIGVTMTYRLAPAHAWPTGAQDVDLALDWLRGQVAGYGGNPARIVVMGHSAGAAHVAGCLARHGCAPGSRSAAAAAILVSGIYALDVYPDGYDYQVYFGADRRLDMERSTVAQLAQLGIPSLFTISEFDPVPFHRNLAAVFQARVRESGRCPQVLYQRGHNHVSVMMQLGSEIDTAGNELAEFIRQLQ